MSWVTIIMDPDDKKVKIVDTLFCNPYLTSHEG